MAKRKPVGGRATAKCRGLVRFYTELAAAAAAADQPPMADATWRRYPCGDHWHVALFRGVSHD